MNFNSEWFYFDILTDNKFDGDFINDELWNFEEEMVTFQEGKLEDNLIIQEEQIEENYKDGEKDGEKSIWEQYEELEKEENAKIKGKEKVKNVYKI